jgi:hypothetical protein
VYYFSREKKKEKGTKRKGDRFIFYIWMTSFFKSVFGIWRIWQYCHFRQMVTDYIPAMAGVLGSQFFQDSPEFFVLFKPCS